MRNLYFAVVGCAVLVCSAACASAAPPVYDLQRIQSKAPAGFAWTVRAAPGSAHDAPVAPGGVYRTLDAPALRAWTAHLPDHSVIRFSAVASPVAHPDPNLRPDTTFWAQLKSFGAFCEKHKVSFQSELHSF